LEIDWRNSLAHSILSRRECVVEGGGYGSRYKGGVDAVDVESQCDVPKSSKKKDPCPEVSPARLCLTCKAAEKLPKLTISQKIKIKVETSERASIRD
jgi:hypothetical protein